MLRNKMYVQSWENTEIRVVLCPGCCCICFTSSGEVNEKNTKVYDINSFSLGTQFSPWIEKRLSFENLT